MIAIGSDHAGLTTKRRIIEHFSSLNYNFKDFGTYNEVSCDYPEYAAKVAKAVAEGECERGILICGTGIGMSIVANKFQGIRAAHCCTLTQAELSRKHNDSNILTIPGREIAEALALGIVDKWLNTEFEGGRHLRRVKKIHELTGM